MQNIYFYKYYKELNRVDKVNYLESTYFMRGDFENAINYNNPVIIIEHNNPHNFTWNYCFIKDLNRYYFIENLTYLNYGVIKLELKQDLLMTFKDKLLENKGFVERNEFEFNPLIEDREINFKYNKIIKEGYVYNISTDSLVNINFDNNNDNNYYIIANVLNNKNQGYIPQNITAPSNSNLNNVFMFYTNQQVGCYYALNWLEFNTLCGFIYNNENRLNSVKSIIGLPYAVNFDIDNFVGAGLYINDENIDSKIYHLLLRPTSNYLIVNDFYLSNFLDIDINNFYMFQPFAKFELYIPFYNWVEFELDKIYNKELLLYYVVDYNTGLADVFLKNKTDDIILFQSTCQLGVKIGISSSNQDIINTQQNANKLNLTLGLMGSGLSLVGGLATGNPLALGYGGVSIANQIASYTNSNAMLFPKNVYQNSSGMSQLFGEKHLKYRLTYPELANDYNDIKHFKGLALNEKRTLNTLKGFSKISSINLTNLYILNNTHFGDDETFRCTITKNEIEELTTILNNGVIFENEE